MTSVSMLNEYCQKNNYVMPKYETTEISGPSHCPDITVELTVNDIKFEANSSSKKLAQRKCATMANDKFKVEQFFKNVEKNYKYKVCEIETSIEDLWEGNTKEVILIIKKSNDLDEHELKTIKLVLKS